MMMLWLISNLQDVFVWVNQPTSELLKFLMWIFHLISIADKIKKPFVKEQDI